MNLLERLTEAHARASKGLDRPRYIYLGEIEYRRLSEIAKQFCVVTDKNAVAPRLTWNGCEVFEVKVPSHLTILCEEGPSPCG
jgi:hypothetical protein